MAGSRIRWGAGALLALGSFVPQGEPVAPAVPQVVHDQGYAGSQECRACHERNFETWSASYHRRMTQFATPEAVLAPLPAATPAIDGVSWRLVREGDSTFATPVSTGGRALAGRQRIALTTGSHHYQMYWLAAPGAKELAQLPLVWHLGEQRWLPRATMFLAPAPPSPYLETGRWPRTCIKCHATQGTPRPEGSASPHVAEVGIACEACHGPAARHVQAARTRRDLPLAAAEPASGEIVNPAELSHERSAQVCGQCHGIHPLDQEASERWERAGFAFRPGDDLASSRALLRGRRSANPPALQAFLDRHPGTLEELFWPDGEVRVSGREYNGLVESACYQRGEMSCLSCHEMHPARSDARALSAWAEDQLAEGCDGPRACLACHPGLQDAEKLAQHTHHAAGSSGSDCLNCHMPYTTYGLTKTIRSHTITSPRLSASLAAGRPNACNLCHLDRTLAWSAEHLQAWYGQPPPELDADQRTVAASVLDALRGDAGLRAITAASYGWAPARAVSGTGWMPYVLSTLAQDPYDAVRFVATRTLRLDARFAGFQLEFTSTLEQQRGRVRSEVVAAWLRTGLEAPADRRASLLLLEGGRLDEARFRALYARVDGREVRLSE